MDSESEKSPVSNNFVEYINTGAEIVQRFEKIMKDLKEKVINLECENNKFKKDNLILEHNNLELEKKNIELEREKSGLDIENRRLIIRLRHMKENGYINLMYFTLSACFGWMTYGIIAKNESIVTSGIMVSLYNMGLIGLTFFFG